MTKANKTAGFEEPFVFIPGKEKSSSSSAIWVLAGTMASQVLFQVYCACPSGGAQHCWMASVVRCK